MCKQRYVCIFVCEREGKVCIRLCVCVSFRAAKCAVYPLDTSSFLHYPSAIPVPEGQADDGVSQQLKMPTLHEGPPTGNLHVKKCKGPSNSTDHPAAAPVLLIALTRMSCICDFE